MKRLVILKTAGIGSDLQVTPISVTAFMALCFLVLATPPPIVAQAGHGWFNVVSYNADPTGQNDSTVAVNNASAAAAASGGGTVYFPNGTYKVNGALCVSNVSFLGEYDGTVITNDGSTVNGYAGYAWNCIAKPPLYSGGFQNVTFDSLKFEGPTPLPSLCSAPYTCTAPVDQQYKGSLATRAAGLQVPIWVEGNLDTSPLDHQTQFPVTNITIRHSKMENCALAPLKLLGLTNAVADDITIFNCADAGFVFDNGLQVTSIKTYESGDNGISVSRVNGHVVVANNISMWAAQAGIQLAGYLNEPASTDLSVTGNEVYQPGNQCFWMDNGPQNAVVSGNQCDKNYQRGTADQPADSGQQCILLRGNLVAGSPPTVTPVYNIDINGNTLYRCSSAGIYVSDLAGNVQFVKIDSNSIGNTGTPTHANSGQATTSTNASGPCPSFCVTQVSGTTFTTAWNGKQISISTGFQTTGPWTTKTYTINQVQDSTHLSLTSDPGNNSNSNTTVYGAPVMPTDVANIGLWFDNQGAPTYSLTDVEASNNNIADQRTPAYMNYAVYPVIGAIGVAALTGVATQNNLTQNGVLSGSYFSCSNGNADLTNGGDGSCAIGGGAPDSNNGDLLTMGDGNGYTGQDILRLYSNGSSGAEFQAINFALAGYSNAYIGFNHNSATTHGIPQNNLGLVTTGSQSICLGTNVSGGVCKNIVVNGQNGNVSFSNTISAVNNISTAGLLGVPPIVGSAVRTSQAGSISTTTFYAATSNALLRITANVTCTSAANGTVQLTVGWTDTSGTEQTTSTSPATCTTLGPTSFQVLSFPIQVKSLTNITYSTTIQNTPSTYDLRVVAEQLTAN